jgi:hypothetical protein
MDPDQVDSGFHRSIVLKPRLTAARVIGSAVASPDESVPIFEPSLAGLGVTFGSPDLTTPPTAGSATTLTRPVAKDAAGLLPAKIDVATRWDLLESGAPPAAIAPGAGGTTTPPPSDDDPGTTATAAPPDDLVVPERAGEVVAPVAATRLKSGGIAVPVRVPTTPGLYRLVATVHQPDGLAYDAATQALLPALIVRVTGAVTASYRIPSTASASAGQPFALNVHVTNLGRAAWGQAGIVPDVGTVEAQPAQRATLVARWVDLGSLAAGGTAGTAMLPAGVRPGASADVSFALTAPVVPGEYLLVLDVLDPAAGSLAALGVPPGIVRVTVSR